jgi:hypothetical protein
MKIAPLDDGRDHDLGGGSDDRVREKPATTTNVELRSALSWCILFRTTAKEWKYSSFDRRNCENCCFAGCNYRTHVGGAGELRVTFFSKSKMPPLLLRRNER